MHTVEGNKKTCNSKPNKIYKFTNSTLDVTKTKKIKKKSIKPKKKNTKNLIQILGDEVIEWNGRSLHGCSIQNVCDIIAETKQEPQVELIVSRVVAANRKAAQASWRHSHSPTRLHQTGIFL